MTLHFEQLNVTPFPLFQFRSCIFFLHNIKILCIEKYLPTLSPAYFIKQFWFFFLIKQDGCQEWAIIFLSKNSDIWWKITINWRLHWLPLLAAYILLCFKNFFLFLYGVQVPIFLDTEKIRLFFFHLRLSWLSGFVDWYFTVEVYELPWKWRSQLYKLHWNEKGLTLYIFGPSKFWNLG